MSLSSSKFKTNNGNGEREKTILKYFLIIAFVVFVGSRVVDYFIEKNTPEFLNKLIDRSTKDKYLMNKIGGYKSLGSRHDRFVADTILTSQFIIHGNDFDLIRAVKAVKRNENWKVISLTDSIR